MSSLIMPVREMGQVQEPGGGMWLSWWECIWAFHFHSSQRRLGGGHSVKFTYLAIHETRRNIPASECWLRMLFTRGKRSVKRPKNTLSDIQTLVIKSSWQRQRIHNIKNKTCRIFLGTHNFGLGLTGQVTDREWKRSGFDKSHLIICWGWGDEFVLISLHFVVVTFNTCAWMTSDINIWLRDQQQSLGHTR